MNRAYRVKTIESEGASYIIGAESRNKAILYALLSDDCDYSYTSYRANLVKSYDNKVIETETNGHMEMEELMPKGFRTWWSCEKCEEGDCFDYAGDDYGIDMYKCRKCGAVCPIPYFE